MPHLMGHSSFYFQHNIHRYLLIILLLLPSITSYGYYSESRKVSFNRSTLTNVIDGRLTIITALLESDQAYIDSLTSYKQLPYHMICFADESRDFGLFFVKNWPRLTLHPYIGIRKLAPLTHARKIELMVLALNQMLVRTPWIAWIDLHYPNEDLRPLRSFQINFSKLRDTSTNFAMLNDDCMSTNREKTCHQDCPISISCKGDSLFVASPETVSRYHDTLNNVAFKGIPFFHHNDSNELIKLGLTVFPHLIQLWGGDELLLHQHSVHMSSQSHSSPDKLNADEVQGIQVIEAQKHMSSMSSQVSPPLTRDEAMVMLADRYQKVCNTPGDIHEHLPDLYTYAKECETILELGVAVPVSTWAFLKGLQENGKREKQLVSCDIIHHEKEVKLVEEVAYASNIDYSYYQKNDLELHLHRMYDLTFIDTWHIYGHLKRELNKFAPLTKKYIIMHDTVIDAEIVESVRDSLTFPDRNNIPMQSRKSGIPEDEIRKGLKYAIDEFLVAHPEWVVDKVKLNNNGLTVLRRKVRALFMVTSIIDLAITRFTAQERFDQTIQTVRSIRQACGEDAIIVILDGSSIPTRIPGSDHHYKFSNPSLLLKDKSVGEILLLEEFLLSPLFAALAPSVDIVCKLSGRYYLNGNFSVSRLHLDQITATNRCKATSKDGGFQDNHNDCLFETTLYSFPVFMSGLFTKHLSMLNHYLDLFGLYIENGIFYGLENMVSTLTPIGVSGIQSISGIVTHQ